MSRNTADIAAVFGGSGSGKSAHVKQRIAKEKPARLLVWDPMGEYGDFGLRVASLSDCLARVKAAGTKGRFALIYTPRGDTEARRQQFDVFCKLAFAAGRVFLVAEELNNVTRPSWAPAGWQDVSSRGRHRGMTVLGVSQRPASVDKDFFSNATRVRSGRLNFDDDIRVLANVLRVPAERIADLKPLQWIERDMQTGRISEGVVTF